jgi:UDP-N-acetylglucosamine:LPS N-acetylglucosamine transferase
MLVIITLRNLKRLAKILKSLMGNKEKLDRMRDAAKLTQPQNAAKTIAEIINKS